MKFLMLALFVVIIAHLVAWVDVGNLERTIPSVPRWVPFLLGVFLLASVYVDRLWCRFLCPLGAAMSMFNRLSLLSIKLNEKCTKCRRCKGSCLMVSNEKTVDPNSTDCIVCGGCVEKCDKDAADAVFRYS